MSNTHLLIRIGQGTAQRDCWPTWPTLQLSDKELDQLYNRL